MLACVYHFGLHFKKYWGFVLENSFLPHPPPEVRRSAVNSSLSCSLTWCSLLLLDLAYDVLNPPHTPSWPLTPDPLPHTPTSHLLLTPSLPPDVLLRSTAERLMSGQPTSDWPLPARPRGTHLSLCLPASLIPSPLSPSFSLSPPLPPRC